MGSSRTVHVAVVSKQKRCDTFNNCLTITYLLFLLVIIRMNSSRKRLNDDQHKMSKPSDNLQNILNQTLNLTEFLKIKLLLILVVAVAL